MAVSGVYGLDCFRDYMEGLEDCYAVIGGTACDILMRNADLDFRATKDIDVILLVEGRLPEVGRAVWSMVRDGGYRCRSKDSNDVHLYRFTEPTELGFPSMIELFSRAPSFLGDAEDAVIVPIPIEDGVSSLSAILLDQDYYDFMKTGRRRIDGVTVLDEAHLVPFKAKAYIDLSARREAGQHADARDIKKHKNDVFRLEQLFAPGLSVDLPDSIGADMAAFCDRVLVDGVFLRQIGIDMDIDEAVGLLRHVYGLQGDAYSGR